MESNSASLGAVKRGPVTLIECVKELRSLALSWESSVLKLKFHNDLSDPKIQETGKDKGEAIANIMLAYRHLEDARMRLGKVIQAMDGGVSIYDKN